jgi:Putative phage serine protease XkdF
MNKQIAFAQLTKVDEAQRLVYGRAVQEVVDRVGEIFDYESSKPLFEKWAASQLAASMGKSSGNIRAMHKDVAAGILVPKDGIIYHDDEKAIDVCAKVTDDDSWNKVLTGTFTGFSIGGSYVKKWEDPELKRTRYTGDPVEISLVDRPAVPTATFFEIQKRDGTTDVKPFKQERREMIKYLVAHGVKADLVNAAPDEDLVERYTEQIVLDRLETLRKGGSSGKLPVYVAGVATAFTVTDPAVGDQLDLGGVMHKATKIEDGKAHFEPMDKAAGDDHSNDVEVQGSPEEVAEFAKLLDTLGITVGDVTKLVKRIEINAEPTEVEVEAVARALCEAESKKPDDLEKGEPLWKSYVATATDQVRKVKAREDVSDADKKRAKSKYGNAKFADEKNKKYPIDTEEHIRAAWNYINKEKNADKYDAEEVKSIKAKIVAAWKAKIDKDGPPSAADDSESKKTVLAVSLAKFAKADISNPEQLAKYEAIAERALLRKGLYACGQFAAMIDSLCCFAESVEWEAFNEGDGSTVAEQIRAGISVLGDALEAMVSEELEEALDEEEDPDEQHAPAMAMASALKDLRKRLHKAEKETDAEDEDEKEAQPDYVVVKTKKLQKCHDTLVKCGAACEGMDKAVTAQLRKEHLAIAQESLDKLHDMIKDMGARCDPLKDAKSDENDKDPLKAVRATLRKKYPALSEAQIEALAKLEPKPAKHSHDDPGALAKALDRVEELTKRLEKLEAEPRAPKARLLVAEKAQDITPTPGADDGKQPAPVLKADGSIDNQATSLAMMKWAQSNGRPLVNTKK